MNPSIDENVRDEILHELDKIEKEHKIKIIYAVESGSRAWGFPSKDSDWDVRFIYVHDKDWYLSIDNATKKDSIEVMLPGELDFSGWELRKALNLFRKCNPSLMEWLHSSIIYIKDDEIMKDIFDLIPKIFNAKSCMYHYLSMAKQNYKDYLMKDEVKIKKYFYVLRPMLSCIYIEKYLKMPPIIYTELLEDEFVNNKLKIEYPELLTEIYNLLDRKLSSQELGLEPKNIIIHKFIEDMIKYYDDRTKTIDSCNLDVKESLDVLFRSIVK